MKNYDKTGGKKGKPAYRTPAWFKNTPVSKGRGFKPPFRRPSV